MNYVRASAGISLRIAMFNLLKIQTRIYIFGTEKCKVSLRFSQQKHYNSEITVWFRKIGSLLLLPKKSLIFNAGAEK